ncbi:MAG TPA: tetratricopeptide repeat protein [Thermoanaerobaculia bacterium]
MRPMGFPTWLSAVVLALLGAACGASHEAPSASKSPPASPTPLARGATFVGRGACAGCHAEQERRWKGSHHDLAMQVASEETVLGNFANATFTHFGVTSTFYRKDGKFFAKTDGPDGRLHEYPIAYTFGVYPLQQYLIAFPGGRYQALNVCWDTRPAKEGGQRWFHLYPKEKVAHDDPLHWTGPYQNWNFMCAECHSTNVKKGYSEAARTYATTWSELDVSCEACHGPGSAHVAWAEAVRTGTAKKNDADRGMAVVLHDPAGPSTWDIDATTGLARRHVPRTSQTEIETCARCHARRSVVAAEYVYGQPLLQTHRPALLEKDLYFDDGQIEDEVYEYGSFLQSKMHASGVSCSDCHDPHDLKVKGSADRVCAGCHLPSKFDTPSHHFHAAGSPGARCVACHMPTRDYMVVHARHDHSLRIPRPDLSAALGTPNACTQCHAGKSDAWAEAAARAWWGDKPGRQPHYGEIVHAAREQLTGAPAALAAFVADTRQPAIRRATAAELLGGDAAVRSALVAALGDPDPLVRNGALTAVDGLDPADRPALVLPLLRDPVLAVRIEAARVLAPSPREALGPADRAALDGALAEFVASQAVDADRGEAHARLGALYTDLGEPRMAESEYRTALALSPDLATATANLADLYRAQGREGDAEGALRAGLAAAPRDPGLHHALGLALVRMKRMPEALKEFEQAAALPPENARYAYVYGVALESSGQMARALGVLQAAHARHPGNREILEALLAYSGKAGDRAGAALWTKKLAALGPAPARP